MFHDVMVDLETLGNRAGCAILSIGAVPFDPVAGVVSDDTFHQVIDTTSCVAAGLTFHQDTLDWWEKQSPQARQVLAEADSGQALSLIDALILFNRWLVRLVGDTEGLRIWGNGASFDQPILTAAYAAAGLEPAWKFFNERCYRTLKNLRPDVPMVRQGTHHNALDDARTQAVHAIALFHALAA